MAGTESWKAASACSMVKPWETISSMSFIVETGDMTSILRPSKTCGQLAMSISAPRECLTAWRYLIYCLERMTLNLVLTSALPNIVALEERRPRDKCLPGWAVLQLSRLHALHSWWCLQVCPSTHETGNPAHSWGRQDSPSYTVLEM